MVVVAMLNEKEDMLVTFSKFNTIIPARASKEVIYSFFDFQVSHALGSVNFDFSLIFDLNTLLTSCREITPGPLFSNSYYATVALYY